jgi:hypothetical protein
MSATETEESMRIERDKNGKYWLADGEKRLPAAEVYSNPMHARCAYVRLLTDELAPVMDAGLLPYIRAAEGRPLEAIVSADDAALCALLKASGFELKRRCYEMTARESDLKPGLPACAAPIEEAGAGEYDECCRLLWAHYRRTHAAVSPLTASYREFKKRLPRKAYFLRGERGVECAAFTEENEIAYVCFSNEAAFHGFAVGVVRRLLAEHGELFFEADDTDPAAMALMRLFDRAPAEEYDTYILD